MEEQRLPHGIADDTTAVKIGKLVNVSVILVGSSSYDFNPNAREDAAAVYGSVTVSATARLISTETDAIIKAPTASGTAIGTIRLKPPPPPPPRDCAVILGHQICGPAPKPPATPQVQLKTPEQLLDEAIDYCSRSLVNQITMAPTSTTVASTLSVIGEADGLTYISKGSDAGLKVGQVLHVYRVVTCSATINSLGEQSCSYVQSGHQIGLARETIYYSP
jgi:hypothetical protein